MSREIIHGPATDRWYVCGSNVDSYEATFRPVLGSAGISDLISKKPSISVIDVMAPTGTLVKLFKQEQLENKLKFGLAVSLTDKRSKKQIERDNGLNIRRLAGDVTEESTWDRIKGELNGRKIDLFMERAEGGLYYVPKSKRFYRMLMEKAWEILTCNEGIMLIQTELGSKIYDWINCLKKSGIEAYCGMDPSKAIIKVIKAPDSPEKLPFLK